MSGKLFEIREKLQHSSIQDFRLILQKKQLQQNDYLNLLVLAFQRKRNAFVHYLQILCLRCKSLINAKINNQILLLEVCKRGVVEEVQAIIQLGADVEVSNQDGNCLYNALLNENKRGEYGQSFQIIKCLVIQFPKLILISHKNPLVFLAIERAQWKIAQFLLQKGINWQELNSNQQNILHILMKNYSKKSEKDILKLREMLVERGVDEEKVSLNGRRPYDMCPGNFAKRLQQEVSTKRKSVEQQNAVKNEKELQKYKLNKNKSEQFEKMHKDVLNSNNININTKQETFPKGLESNRVVLKIDNKSDQLQIMKQADQILERYTQEKEKDLKRKKGENEKGKNKIEYKNRVMTPEELKGYLDEDITYETQLIEQVNNEQKQFFNKLIDKLTTRIKEQLGVQVKIFGSFATGLCLPQSDIDVVVIPRQQEEDFSSFRLLENISELLGKLTEQIENIKYIKTASVPILKIQCTQLYKQKKIDITYQDQKHNGLKSVALIREYLDIYPQLRSLTFILKKFIYSARLFDPYSGGISSYGLILMIVAYIQNDNRERKMRAKQIPPPTVAQLLIGFLRFYGFKMNYIAKQIGVLQPVQAKQQMDANQLDMMHRQPIFPTVMDLQLIYSNDWQPRPKLVIMDPLNIKNNIGRATHKIREIKTAFEMAYVCIHTNGRCGKRECGSYKRIKYESKVDIRFEGNKRPCCIIKRMLKSTNIIATS